MSQSQGGLLPEDELRDIINDKFNFRLERDALLKPSKDVIFEIYARFLDEAWPRWRRPKKGVEEQPPIKATMVGWIRFIVSRYNNSYTFNLSDLLAPTRQRTRLFMNILVYHSEKIHEVEKRWQEDKEELLMEQEELALKKQELAQLTDEIEELAITISTSKPVEELKATIDRGEQELDCLKRECEDLEEEKEKIKAKLLNQRESNKTEETRAGQRRDEIQKLRNTLETLNSGHNIKKEADDLERMVDAEEDKVKSVLAFTQKSMKRVAELESLASVQRLFDLEGAPILASIQNRIAKFDQESQARTADIQRYRESIHRHERKEEEMQKQLDDRQCSLERLKSESEIESEKAETKLEARKKQIKDDERSLLEEIERLQSETEKVKKLRADEKLKLDAQLELHKKYAERAESKLKLFVDKLQESKSEIERIRAIVAERRDKIQALLGGMKSEIIELPADRTYIKESKSS